MAAALSLAKFERSRESADAYNETVSPSVPETRVELPNELRAITPVDGSERERPVEEPKDAEARKPRVVRKPAARSDPDDTMTTPSSTNPPPPSTESASANGAPILEWKP